MAIQNTGGNFPIRHTGATGHNRGQRQTGETSQDTEIQDGVTLGQQFPGLGHHEPAILPGVDTGAGKLQLEIHANPSPAANIPGLVGGAFVAGTSRIGDTKPTRALDGSGVFTNGLGSPTITSMNGRVLAGHAFQG